MKRFLIHGLAISTAVDLRFPVSEEPAVKEVVVVDLGALTDASPPPGVPLLTVWSGPVMQARLFDLGTRFVFQIGELLQAEISSDATWVGIRRTTDVTDELLGIYLVGMISASIVALLGDLALHASGVLYDERLILFAGASGQGKSTMAAMGVVAGGTLFADDVVRLGVGNGTVVAHRGSMQIRLRPSASVDLRPFDEISRSTIDGRIAVVPATSAPLWAHPFAIVIPLPDRDIDDVRAERVAHSEAFVELHRCLRVGDWADRDRMARQFGSVADVAAQIPVIRCRVPWDRLDLQIGRTVRDEVVRAAMSASGR